MRNTDDHSTALHPPAARGRTARSVAVLAIVLVTPGALLIGQAVSALALRPAGINVLWNVETVNLAEAVAARDVAGAARLIEQGADVNTPMRVRRGWLTHRDVTLTPIEAAVAADRPNAFDLLRARGALIGPSQLPMLICLAQHASADEVLARLREMDSAGPDCGAFTPPW